MNKRICSLLAAAGLALAACDGDKGDKGDPGPAGPQGPPGSGTVIPGDPGTGLRYVLESATVTAGAAPTVTFRVLDATAAPLALKSGSTLAFTPQFTIAKINPDGNWNSYLTRTATGRAWTDARGAARQPALATTQQAAAQAATADRIADNGDGTWTYTFAAPLEGVDPAATHRVGIYGNRVFEGVTYSDSQTLDFVPAGGTPVDRDAVADEACNRCHTVVNAHGGARRGVKLCLTCHTPQTVDPETGNSVDMTVMVHKIHKGRLLSANFDADPNNDYVVVGFNNTLFDFTHVAMGPSHSTYFSTTPATAPSAADRGIIRECRLCHQGPQADRFQTSISTANCTTCHDDTNPATGQNHAIGGVPILATDSACSTCHAGPNAIITVNRAHSVNYEPTRNIEFPAQHTLAVKIDAVRNATPGAQPAVDFTITLDGAPYDITTRPLGTLSFQYAGPVASDYQVVTANAQGVPSPASALTAGVANPAVVTPIDPAAGRFTFTFPAAQAIPAGATGVFVFSFEAFFAESVTTPDGVTTTKPYAADPIFHNDPATPADDRNVRFVNVASGADVTATTERRKVVDNAKCNNCHEDLGFHGNRSRQGVDYCATCHNPTLSNAARARFRDVAAAPLAGAPQTATPPANTPGLAGVTTPVFIAESVAINVMIHRIHMGADLTNDYFLGTNRTAADPTPGAEGLADFSRFASPSPVANCQTCHDGQTYGLPPSTPGRAPVRRAVLDCGTPDAAGWCTGRTPNATVPVLVTPPQKAVCTACHDSPATNAHADLNTIAPMTENAVETCATCHGPGRDFDAVQMHPPVLTPSIDLPESQ
jgi:OmcA/MtrC family decaheme c-type cytochrome